MQLLLFLDAIILMTVFLNEKKNTHIYVCFINSYPNVSR